MSEGVDFTQFQIPQPSPIMFDSLGSDGFAAMVNVMTSSRHGQEGFTPGPAVGVDRGIDNSYTTIAEFSPITQIKHHSYTRSRTTGSAFTLVPIREFEEWLPSMFVQNEGKPGPYIFVTNVFRNQPEIERCQKLQREYQSKGAVVEYIDGEGIVTWLNANPQHYYSFLRVYTTQDLNQTVQDLQKANEEARGLAKQATEEQRQKALDYQGSTEFIQLSERLAGMSMDLNIAELLYAGMVYLIQPVYLDDRDGSRSTIRRLFHLSEEIEGRVVESLKQKGIVDVTGDLLSLKKQKEAKEGAARIVEAMGEDFEKVLILVGRAV